MRALVVYESVAGHTRLVAEAVAHAMAADGRVELVDVAHAPTTIPADLTLLVVGASAQTFTLGRGKDDHDAAGQFVLRGRTLAEWLDMLHVPLGYGAAAFDTRVKKPFLPGSAAKTTEKRLGHVGFKIVTPAEGFIIDGNGGRLVAGELERATLWGSRLGAAFAHR
jgi:flavodoxin